MTGATTLGSTLAVAGDLAVATNKFTVAAATGAISAAGNATLGGTLGVTGATTLSSTLGVAGTATLSSTLGVTGATTLSSTLGVTGATTLGSTLSVAGNVQTAGTLAVGGGSAIGKILTGTCSVASSGLSLAIIPVNCTGTGVDLTGFTVFITPPTGISTSLALLVDSVPGSVANSIGLRFINPGLSLGTPAITVRWVALQ